MKYKIKIRRDLAEVRASAEIVDGKIFYFEYGWLLTEKETSIYVGENAMLPRDDTYPLEAPHWIASGDLEEVH